MVLVYCKQNKPLYDNSGTVLERASKNTALEWYWFTLNRTNLCMTIVVLIIIMYILFYAFAECLPEQIRLTGSEIRQIVYKTTFSYQLDCKTWLVKTYDWLDLIQFKISFQPNSPKDFLEIRDGFSQYCSAMLVRYPSKDKRYPPIADNITWTTSKPYLRIKYYGSTSSQLVVNVWPVDRWSLRGMLLFTPRNKKT